jgi:hypothetical protein
MFVSVGERRRRAGRIWRRLILAVVTVVSSCLLLGVGALDGGSATRPAGACAD